MDYKNWKCPHTLSDGRCELSATLKPCGSDHCKSAKHNNHSAVKKTTNKLEK